MDQFKSNVQSNEVVFLFHDQKMPVTKESVEVDITYYEEQTAGARPWVLQGNNKLIVILVPVGFFVLFLVIVIIGVCVS